ncbi:hypothetical protein [Streptomyces canus]|uniref:hypothetical protein n=1 Tax=Streptomyces canus TaxID=58343 RepID=UPI002E35CB89|nr:hypothetical protein [Streptomyces canus]
MLARGSEYGMGDEETAERIAAWTGGAEGEFAEFAVAGARVGVAFARDAVREPDLFDNFNDPAWLSARFTAAVASFVMGVMVLSGGERGGSHLWPTPESLGAWAPPPRTSDAGTPAFRHRMGMMMVLLM